MEWQTEGTAPTAKIQGVRKQFPVNSVRWIGKRIQEVEDFTMDESEIEKSIKENAIGEVRQRRTEGRTTIADRRGRPLSELETGYEKRNLD